MIHSDHPGFYRVKFSVSEVVKKYNTEVYLNILKGIELGTNNQYTIEPDVSVWFPVNYYEVWEC
jgi:hypothetical protein